MKKGPKKLLLLDFDGVIVNSIDECLLTSYNAFQKFENNGVSLALDLSDITPPQQKYFNLYRKFVRPAGEYYLLHRAYKDKIEIIDSKSYHELLIFYKDKLPYYQKEFFNERKRLRLVNREKWLRLHSVYNNLAECWNILINIFNIYIVSNKDKASIILLMNHFNLLVNENQIFGAENGNDKSIIITNIINENSAEPDNVYFIDDNLDNLINVKKIGIKLYLAMWGYGNPDENEDSTIKEIYHDNILQSLI